IHRISFISRRAIPTVPLYRVSEGNEPSFFTTSFSWDSTKANASFRNSRNNYSNHDQYKPNDKTHVNDLNQTKTFCLIHPRRTTSLCGIDMPADLESSCAILRPGMVLLKNYINISDQSRGFPVVSISIGDSAQFVYGDSRDVDKANEVLLKLGDVLVFGGKSRHVYHGVKKVIPNSAPL
nr:oxoglutarate/iron-dependent dioxygenase [Tanacetum cinerariifolium]